MDERRCIVNVRGEELHLLAERAVWWPERATLFVADIHFGRIASYRARGAPVPGDTLGETLERLGRLIDELSVQRVMVLGDLVQERAGLTDEVVRRVGAAMDRWVDRWGARFALIPGNHEHQVGPLPAQWPVEHVDGGSRLGPFALHHHPREARDNTPSRSDDDALPFELAGHYHPTVCLRSGGDRLRLPCFAFSRSGGVLPAFHTMTNGVEMSPESYRVYVIAEDEVIALQQA